MEHTSVEVRIAEQEVRGAERFLAASQTAIEELKIAEQEARGSVRLLAVCKFAKDSAMRDESVAVQAVKRAKEKLERVMKQTELTH